MIAVSQDFAACFKDLPEHYTKALYDLYQQVNATGSKTFLLRFLQIMRLLRTISFVLFAGAALDKGQFRGMPSSHHQTMH